jgi:hypothetical protein
MTTVQITLPDQLAQEAAEAGFLEPKAFADLLRKQLRAKAAGELFAAMDKMNAVDDPPYMSAEEIAEEIAAIRMERRASPGA